MTSSAWRLPLAQCALFIVCMGLVLGAIDIALAQPFGMTRSQAPPEIGGITGWILSKQAEFYRMMSGTIRAAKADGSAAWTLMGISFPLRHLPRRRPRPRQGGDLVLSRRQ